MRTRMSLMPQSSSQTRIMTTVAVMVMTFAFSAISARAATGPLYDDDLPRVDIKGEVRPGAEDPWDAQIFKDFPITGKIEMEVGGETLVNARPWQAYDGEMVALYGYINYAPLVELVNDTDFTPFHTVIDGEELGFLQFSIITYTSSNSGGYHELVLATPVTGFGVESKYQEPPMEIANCTKTTMDCLYYTYFSYKGIKWFVIKMWLDKELPVATGTELSGIQKAFSPSLLVNLTEVDENITKWDITIDDEGSDTFINMSFTDIKPETDPIATFDIDFEAIQGLVGTPGMPETIGESILTMTKRASEIYHQSYLVQPKGAYPPAFGTTINPITMNNLGSGYPEGFQDEYALRSCPDLKISVGGKLAPLEIGKYPTDCYVIHNVQAVICPPTNIGPYKDMCNVTFPWLDYEHECPLKEEFKTDVVG